MHPINREKEAPIEIELPRIDEVNHETLHPSHENVDLTNEPYERTDNIPLQDDGMNEKGKG